MSPRKRRWIVTPPRRLDGNHPAIYPRGVERTLSEYGWVFLVGLWAFAGCEFKGDASGRPMHGNIAQADAWQPEPMELRFYPTTRFVMRDDTPILEARIELLDAMGDSVKAAGTVSFELVEAPNPLGGGMKRRLYSWEGIELLTLEHQRTYYDAISRGYRFHLRLDNYELSEYSTLVKVTFTPVVGERLMDQKVIEPGF